MHPPNERGFSRADLMALVVVIVFLGAWFGVNQSADRVRIAKCAGNLKALGGALQAYAKDQADNIPAAGIDLGETKISWDQELFPYLSPAPAGLKGEATKRELLMAALPRLICPSDVRIGHARTYAMAERDMAPGWPPSPDDETGVGVWWDRKSVLMLPDYEAWDAGKGKPEALPRLKLSVLTSPARTLLFTELPLPDNKAGALAHARVSLPDQEATLNTNNTSLHSSRFNYVLADGHVELMSALQSHGIWNIKPGN